MDSRLRGNDGGAGRPSVKSARFIALACYLFLGFSARAQSAPVVVRALGGHGEYVDTPRAIRPALERALSSGMPACVNVRIDAEANAAVSANSMAV